MNFCTFCNKQINKHRYNFHLKSKFHLKNEMKMKKSTENVEHENQEEVETHEDNKEIDEVENEEETKYNEVSTQTMESDYLSDFNNINYQIQEEKQKEVVKSNALILKDVKHKFRQKKNDDDYSVKSDELFSDRNKTPILGKNKRELIAKIKQYKFLFPEQLTGGTYKRSQQMSA